MIHQADQRIGEPRDGAAERRRVLAHRREQPLVDGLGLVHVATGERAEHRRADGPQVRTRVDLSFLPRACSGGM